MHGDVINIYADVLWSRWQRWKKAEDEKSVLEKGRGLISKLSGGNFGSPVGLFLHESKHALDFQGKTAKVLGAAYALTYLALPLSPILYLANPYEIRARGFAKKHGSDSRWQNILTISPKPKQ